MPYFVMSIIIAVHEVRVVIFDDNLKIHGQAQENIRQYRPDQSWVEYDTEEIWATLLKLVETSVYNAKIERNEIIALGLACQRDATVVWERTSGRAINRAIAKMDRRNASYCDALKQNNMQNSIQERTGLILHTDFAATKISWILDNIPNAKSLAWKGELAFGTLDSFILSRLTQGRIHAIDATNASRTMLYNIETCQWDEELLALFELPMAMMPNIYDSAADFGFTNNKNFGVNIPICAMIAETQASIFGQGCYFEGMVKSGLGEDAVTLINTGEQLIRSNHHLNVSIGFQLDGVPNYVLEGTCSSPRNTMNWLTHNLTMLNIDSDIDALVKNSNEQLQLYMVPSFQGDSGCPGQVV